MVEQNALKDYVGSLTLVCLTRRFPGTFQEHGFVLGVSDYLVLLHRFQDFREDGYAVYRLNDITSIRSNKYERKWEQVLRAEGLLDGVGRIAGDVPLDNIYSLILELQSRRGHVIIDCEDCPDAKHTGMHMGEIISIGRRCFEMREYDATGKWYSLPFEIPFASVTRVEFESPYITIFSKYVD